MKAEYIFIICLGAVLFIEVFSIIFKTKIINPIFERKEKGKNPDFILLKNKASYLKEMRNKKKEEFELVKSNLDKYSNYARYLPKEIVDDYIESFEPTKNQFYQIMTEIFEYDEQIKKIYEELDRIRKDRNLRWL